MTIYCLQKHTNHDERFSSGCWTASVTKYGSCHGYACGPIVNWTNGCNATPHDRTHKRSIACTLVLIKCQYDSLWAYLQFLTTAAHSCCQEQVVHSSVSLHGSHPKECKITERICSDRSLNWSSAWLSWMRNGRSLLSTGKWTRSGAAWSTPSTTRICMRRG